MTHPGDEHPVVALEATMARLRRECAWKARQTHASLARYLLEETHETLEAIESGDAAHLREELGDLLLQVLFHAAIAAEAGEYDLGDVAADLDAKLHRRNPHVFGDEHERAAVGDAHAINEQWELIKRTEKQRSHPAEGIPTSLPALLYADKVVDRVQRSGTEIPTSGDGLGERLLALVVEAHDAGVDPEQALRSVVRRLAEQ